jgi:ATP-dependent RNA helicase DeaD
MLEETEQIPSFEALGLSEPILKAIGELGYEEPTPIQARTIARLLEGADVIAQAQTGTGKTAAFALPMLERIDALVRTPQALVLAPTRELAVQVAAAIQAYSKYLRVSVLAIYGGQPIDRQLRPLERGVQIVVGTPGRVLDHLERGSLDLSGVRMVVLDEADEMLDMGFIEDVESILQRVPNERQTALFSATMPAPIAALARRYMSEPERVSIEARHMTVPQIEQVAYDVGRRDKFEVLARILEFENPSSAIVFCRTKSEVDGLGARLIARGFPAETLHGDLSQVQRDRVMARFRTGQVKLLIATDVAARGLDIEHVSHVFNFDIPFDPEVYVHRIGRTGRAGRAGCAVTLVGIRERRMLQTIERVTGATIERRRLPSLADVVARRQEAFRDTLRSTVEAGGLEPFGALVAELSKDLSVEQVAAAALRLLIGEQPDSSHDPLAEPEFERRDDRRMRQPDRFEHSGRSFERGGRRFEREQGGRANTRLQLDVGKADGVRPGDIVGAIANEAGVSGRAIGAIELFDRFSFVEVPDHLAERVVRALRSTTIRGRSVAPRLAQPKR